VGVGMAGETEADAIVPAHPGGPLQLAMIPLLCGAQ